MDSKVLVIGFQFNKWFQIHEKEKSLMRRKSPSIQMISSGLDQLMRTILSKLKFQIFGIHVF